MRVTKWGECGILCSLHLAEHFGKGTVGAPDIASGRGLDLQYVQQILQRLRKGKLVESSRGPHGGYRLARPPEQISLREILLATQGDTFEIICDYAPIHPESVSPHQCTTRETCNLHGVWQDLKTAINNLLEERKLSDLITTTDENTTLVQLKAR